MKDPRVKGTVYYSGYWGTLNLVTDVVRAGTNKGTICEISLTPIKGYNELSANLRIHCTPWDKRDELVLDPRGPGLVDKWRDQAKMVAELVFPYVGIEKGDVRSAH